MASTSSVTNKGKRDGPYAEATRRNGPEKTFAHAMKELEEDSQLLGDPRVHLGLDDAETPIQATQKTEDTKPQMIDQQMRQERPTGNDEGDKMHMLMELMIMQQRAILTATATAQTAAEGVARALQMVLERSAEANPVAAMAAAAAVEAVSVVKYEVQQKPQAVIVTDGQLKTKEKLVQEVIGIMTKVGAAFETDVRRHLKASRRVDKLEYEVEFMKRQRLEYPAGVKAFASTVSNLELDECLDGAKDSDLMIMTTIPKGTMRRDAMKIIHHGAHKEMKKIELEAARSTFEKTKEKSKKEKLMERCVALIKEWKENENKVEGLENAQASEINEQLVIKHMEEIYAKLIRKLRKEKEDEDKEEKRREQEKRR
jgi:hypothetical protein